MRRWICTVVMGILLATFPINHAIANGGPVAWTGSTAHSGIAPKQQNDLRLVREQLEIRLLDDFNRYKVRAQYQLANLEPARTVRYGVPINWSTKDTLANVANGISITLNGRKQKTCQPAEFSKRIKPEEIDGYELDNAAWCVSELTIPSGQNIELVLEYTAQLNYVDWETSKSALTNFDDRKLLYELWPAGYWRGPVEQLDIRIDLGPYAGLVKSHNLPGVAPGYQRQITKTFRNLDLRTFESISMSFDSMVLLHPRQIATWNRSAPEYSRRKATIKTSSVLQPQEAIRYEPKNLVDGDPKTAWCEGRPDDGLGEWVEIRIAGVEPGKYECRIQGLALVPGYARTNSIYISNNRICKLRVSHCETPNNYRDVSILKSEAHANRAAVMINLDYDDRLPVNGYRSDESTRSYRVEGPQKSNKDEEWSSSSNCYRITILEVEPGTKYRDSCISEIAPVFNCG